MLAQVMLPEFGRGQKGSIAGSKIGPYSPSPSVCQGRAPNAGMDPRPFFLGICPMQLTFISPTWKCLYDSQGLEDRDTVHPAVGGAEQHARLAASRQQ